MQSKKIKRWDSYFEEKKYYDEDTLKHKIEYYSDLFKHFDCKTEIKYVIEIGSGHGKNTEIFVEMFEKYFALEPNNVLLNKLIKLKKKYPNMKTGKYKCESLIKLTNKVDFLIFANSFQFTDFNICEQVINKILSIGGFLLVLLPFVGIKSRIDENWRKQLFKAIKYIINMNNFELLYIGNYGFQQILFLKKIKE